MLGWLVGKIYEALFTDVDSGAKKTHILVKIFLALIVLACVGLGLYKSIIALVAVIVVMLFSGLSFIIIPVLIISSIPALWLSLSNAVVLLFNNTFNYFIVVEVYVRALTASVAILFFIVSLSPYEISRILHKIGLKRHSLASVMVWRLMPLALRDVIEAYGIQKLKKQALWKGIAIATASMLEKSEMLVESNGLKLEAGLVEPLPYRYSMKYTVLYLAVTIAMFLLLLVY